MTIEDALSWKNLEKIESEIESSNHNTVRVRGGPPIWLYFPEHGNISKGHFYIALEPYLQDKNIPEFMRLLKHKDDNVRYGALLALGKTVKVNIDYDPLESPDTPENTKGYFELEKKIIKWAKSRNSQINPTQNP